MTTLGHNALPATGQQPPANDEDPAVTHEIAASGLRVIDKLIDRIANGEFIYLTRAGQRVAALVPVDIAQQYQQIGHDYRKRMNATSSTAKSPNPGARSFTRADED